MKKIIRIAVIVLLASLYFERAIGQIFFSKIEGNISKYKSNVREGSIKVIINSLAYSDSVILNKDVNSFMFNNVPYGIYELRVVNATKGTYVKDFIIEDILVNREMVILDTIYLFPIKTCGDRAQIWVYEYNLQKKDECGWKI